MMGDSVRRSFRSDFKCTYCNKILQEPIFLPCEDTICKHHLQEEVILKSRSIECATCKQEFFLDTLDYKLNKIVKVLLEKEAHLSEEEVVSKATSKESLVEFYQLLDVLRQDKASLNADIQNHFQEIRRIKSIYNEKSSKRK